MHLTLPLTSIPNEIGFLQMAGYHQHKDPVTKKESWAKRFTTNHYPRFHIYIHKKGNVITFDLHIDQKKPSYRGVHAHSGEYDGPVVEKEAARLKSLLKTNDLPILKGVPDPGTVEKHKPAGLLGRLFG